MREELTLQRRGLLPQAIYRLRGGQYGKRESYSTLRAYCGATDE